MTGPDGEPDGPSWSCTHTCTHRAHLIPRPQGPTRPPCGCRHVAICHPTRAQTACTVASGQVAHRGHLGGGTCDHCLSGSSWGTPASVRGRAFSASTRSPTASLCPSACWTPRLRPHSPAGGHGPVRAHRKDLVLERTVPPAPPQGTVRPSRRWGPRRGGPRGRV